MIQLGVPIAFLFIFRTQKNSLLSSIINYVKTIAVFENNSSDFNYLLSQFEKLIFHKGSHSFEIWLVI